MINNSNRCSTLPKIRSREGQTLVEFAFVLPLLLIFMTIIVQLGVLFFTQMIVSNAAWEGARAGATIRNSSNGDLEIMGAVISASAGLDSNRLSIEIHPSQDEFPRDQPYPQPRGSEIQVIVTYPVSIILPTFDLPVTGKGVSVMEYQNP
jgi:uncharacterized protein (UPF0333 family)